MLARARRPDTLALFDLVGVRPGMRCLDLGCGGGEVTFEIARLTGGAHCHFDTASAQRLADLLKAVAAFAVGGAKALAAQNSEAARLLLTQVKKS
jgi:cyclopropane fatty-acyl-phospholipid synthase-like methyltransferase